MSVITKAFGVHQSDLIIKAALMAGLHELRVSPHLIDYCFTSLQKDELTSRQYGENEIRRAQEWFLANEVVVTMSDRIGEPHFPCVTIELMKSSEIRNTLGDENYEVMEDKVEGWPNLTPPFTPVSYSRTTGRLILPPAVANGLVVVSGQVVATTAGSIYEILEVRSRNEVYIKPNVRDELAGATIRGSRPPKVVLLNSARFTESYAIGVHVQGDPNLLTYLHSIVVFVLLRRRRDLLEGRGLECTQLDSGPIGTGKYFEAVEAVFSRFVQLSGEVLQWWPDDEQERIESVAVQTKLNGGGKMVPPGTLGDEIITGDEDDDLEDDDEFVKFT